MSLSYDSAGAPHWTKHWLFIMVCLVIAMIVWNLVNPRGGGVNSAMVAGLIFTVPMVALLRARPTFQTD